MAQRPPAERFDEVLDACAQGFGEPRAAAEWAAAERTLWELDRTWVAVDGDAYVATATAYSFELTVPGGVRVPAAGVAQVAVLPTHRRQGRLREVMVALLDQAAERGDHYALLNASESGIYGRFGFGQADRVLRIELDTDHVELTGPVADGTMALVDAREATPVLAPLYDRIARHRPGSLARSEAWWAQVLADKESWRGVGDPFVAVHHDADGAADGYVIYRSRLDQRRGHLAGTIELRELEAATPEVEAALWRYVCAIDLHTRVVADPRPVDDPLPWRLTEPRRAWVTAATDLLWARPVDVAACLAGRAYTGTDELVLAVTDATLPANGGTYRLTAAPAGAAVARVDDAPDLTLDVSALGSIVLGGIDAGELAAAGRITEHTPGAAARADRLFRWRPAVYCATKF